MYSTILGWSYYGERAVEYLFGKRSIVPCRVLWVMADMMNMLMAIPNLAALIALNGIIVAETRKYLRQGRIDDSSAD